MTIQDELEAAVEYARKYLAIGKESYRKIWYKLNTCPDSGKWSNLLQLSKLVFSLPFTTSCVEQIFSKLKIIKTSHRTGLHTTTICDCLRANRRICLRVNRRICDRRKFSLPSSRRGSFGW